MSTIADAMREICAEKGIPYESVLETVEAALAAAYRKDFGEKNQNTKVTFHPETGGVDAFDEKEVVTDAFVEEALKEIEERQRLRQLEEEARERGEIPDTHARTIPERDVEYGENDGEEGKAKYNPKLHLALAEAQKVEPEAKVGDTIRIPLEVPGTFGRMAAQTAKQVIMQRLREAERDTIFNSWKGHEHEVVMGIVQRREGRTVLVDLGPRATAFLREDEQIPTDRYTPGTRLQAYLSSVGKTMRGPELLISRTHPELVRHLFRVEVPEVSNGTVELAAVAREPGSRAKVAVRSTEENVDPIGACIGQRGTRVQTIIAELSGEKIDIILYDEDPATFIANAMAPAKVSSVQLHEQGHVAVVYVPADQFSLAIGRSGQNVRLAAKLTGWKINVRDVVESGVVVEAAADDTQPVPEDAAAVASTDDTAPAPSPSTSDTESTAASEGDAEPHSLS